MQMFPDDPTNLWAVCDGQEDRKCAEHCYARYFSGSPDEYETDVAYWTDWVARRKHHVREMASLVELFIAPARYLSARFQQGFGLAQSKLVDLDYGFARDRMAARHRVSGEPNTFGILARTFPRKASTT